MSKRKKKLVKEKIDYPEFIKLFMHSDTGHLVRFSFDIFQTLKTIADLIAPFSWLFIKDRRLKQAFELIYDILREKRAELNQLQVKAAAKKEKWNENTYQMVANLEHYLLETNIPINKISKKQLHEVFRKREEENK